MPWQWEEMEMRCTVGEIDKVILGARRREMREWDRVAWLAANLMNAAGSKPRKPGDAVDDAPVSTDDYWTPDKLLGRALTPDDPRDLEPAEPTDEELAIEAEGRERVMRAKAMLAQARIKAGLAAGVSSVADVTPPEPS